MSASERPSEVHSLHFDFSGVPAETALTYHLGMREYPILPHTEETRNAARESNRFLRLLPPSAITHRADVHAPGDAVTLGFSTRDLDVDGIRTTQVLSMAIKMPRAARLRDVRRGRLLHGNEPHPKLTYRDLGSELLQAQHVELEQALDDIANLDDPYETAVAILFQHPELVNLYLEAKEGGPQSVIEECIRKALKEFGLLTKAIAAHPEDWSTVVRVMDDGKPAFDDQGKPLFTMDLHPDVKERIKLPLGRALVYAKQSEGLKGQLWSLQYGMTKAAYSGSVRPKSSPPPLHDAPRAAADVRWKIKNLTPSSGLALEDVVPYTPGGSANWRAEGYWSSQDDKSVGPFTPELKKALTDGKLWLIFDDLEGLLFPDRDEPTKYYVNLEKRDDARKASGTCRLNADGTELQYLVTTSAGPFTKACFALKEQGGRTRALHDVVVRNAGSSGTMMVKAKNHWMRHLSAYVEFLDPAGKPKAPADWATRFPVPEGARLFDTDSTKRFLEIVNPVEAIMGIPLSADTTHLVFQVPAEASMVRVSFGGLGSGTRDPVSCLAGEILTVTLELALPVVVLAAGGKPSKEEGGLLKLIKEKPVVCAILASLAGIYTITSENPGKTALKIGQKLLPALAKAGITKLSAAIAEMIAIGAAKRAIPFVNIAFLVADIAATAAAVGQTSTAIANSPRVHVTEITRSIDLKVTITSSSVYHTYPAHHHHLSVVVVYDSGATLPALTQMLPPTTIKDDIIVQFREVPAAGNLRVMVFFYAENSWQSGQGASPWMKAEGNTGGSPLLEVPKIEIAINEVPLGTWSVYEHMEKIGYEGDKHVWVPAVKEPPTATKFTPSKVGGTIEKLHSVTIAQYPQMVGYAWQSSDQSLAAANANAPNSTFTVQNLSVLDKPENAYAAPATGFTNPGGIAYDITSPDNGTGRNFFIDPSRGKYEEGGDPASGFHLRRVRLQFEGPRPEFKIRTNESWGRFREAVDAMVVHPDGYVYGIRRGVHAIFRLQLPDKPYSDAEAPLAVALSGEGSRHGLIQAPIAITLALDGRVLVLEEKNERVQCFDVNGNPVAYFGASTSAATPILSVRREPRLNLLDMACEAKGHVFVLGYSGDGRKPEDYRIDLYDPSGAFLTSTRNFTAARITVDLLRNLFALNYETLRGRDRRLEPSISHWRPPAPPKKGNA